MAEWPFVLRDSYWLEPSSGPAALFLEKWDFQHRPRAREGRGGVKVSRASRPNFLGTQPSTVRLRSSSSEWMATCSFPTSPTNVISSTLHYTTTLSRTSTIINKAQSLFSISILDHPTAIGPTLTSLTTNGGSFPNPSL
jgi:hypothetical protein